MSTSTAQQSNSPDFASTLQFYSSSAPPATMSNQDKMVNLGKRAGQSIQTNAPVVLGAISSAIAGAMNTVKDAASGATGASTTAKTDDLDTFDLELGKVDTAGQTSSGSSSASNGQAGENASLISQWTSSAMQSGTQAFQGMKQQASVSTRASWVHVPLIFEYPEVNNEAIDMASTRDTIGKFIMFFAAGCICMMLALTFLPMVVIAPQKFALMFTVGSCLILMSFSVLKGHAAFIAHIMSPEKRLFTAGYAASLVATLYGALLYPGRHKGPHDDRECGGFNSEELVLFKRRRCYFKLTVKRTSALNRLMADVAALLESIERSQSEVESVKLRIANVAGKLNQVRMAVATSSGPSSAMKDVGTNRLRDEIAKARDGIKQFKNLIKDAAEAAAAEEQTTMGFGALKKRMAHDDKTKTLYERIGGDLTLETAVEMAYGRALQDPRTRAYFEKNQRKMASIRQKMHQFLSGLMGGPVLYDEENVKPAHYHMNITDYHFDAVVEHFQNAVEELGVHPNAVLDAVTAFRTVRREITTGCTVRMEVARRNMEKGKDLLYRKVGEAKGVAKFMERLYDLICIDTRIKKFFQGKDVNKVKKSQTVFFTEVLGGDNKWKGRSIPEIHKGMNVDDYHFDCLLMNAEKALSGLGVEEDTIDEVLVVLEGFRAEVLNRKRGINAAHKVVDGKTVLERLGGEMNMESLIETMYSGCLVDPRVKYYFALEPAKMTNLKSKMAQVIVGLSGGPAVYDLKRLRPLHYNMNITDYHFDTMLENLRVACEMMELTPELTRDIAEVAASVRPDITAGCTVRLEIARKKTESAGTDGLFCVLGGDEGVMKFMDKLYESVLLDDRIQHFFSGAKLDSVKKSQAEYVAQLFGSAREYMGRELPRIHAMIRIADFHFDCFIEQCRKNLAACGLDSDSVDECTVLLETARASVVHPDLRKHDSKRAQQLANMKPMYDRIGGEPALTKLIDIVYDKALVDTSLRSFLEKNKAKVSSIKKKMIQFLCGITGGPTSYDANDMLPAHYNMNITDYHFDAMLILIRETFLRELDMKRSDSRELMKLLQPVRPMVTTGFGVRREIALKNLSLGKDQLYRKLGGEKGIRETLNVLYQIVATDARIKEFFVEKKIKKIKEGQTKYFIEMFGGPKTSTGRELYAIHENLGVNDFHFDAFMADLQRAMLGTGVDEVIMDEVLITVEQVRPQVMGRKTVEVAGVMKNGKTLLMRLGGDMNLESLVENMYDRAVVDSRVQFFFNRDKATQRRIRMKMYQYLSGAFGGPVQYDPANLKPAHYNMNITNYHFDAILEILTRAAKEMNIDADTMDDMTQVVNGIRSDVTIGCTVRMEAARKKNETDGLDQLFMKLGGHEGISTFISRLYEFVERDNRINMFFEGSKLELIKKAQGDYISMLLGGSSEYNGRSLEEIHQTLAMTDFHLDCFLQCVQKALRDCGAEQDTTDEVVVRLESVRKAILHAHYSDAQYS
ncbi:hypothetical protein FOL46_006286 [Perkinsus olseni]|uniref:Uncharacterized protein n=1 Tax=Perkinsus olseni TaxID=32597 RepID=A0A7J6MQI7_PEROL|nr:hypothetical protein FOL46_006286 [Perkinsus olseni]